MKIFVTGNNGFIGQHAVIKSLTEGHDVINPQYRVSITEDLELLEKWCRAADVIIHCAANIKGDKEEIQDTNVVGSKNVGDAAKGKLLVYMNTTTTSGPYGKSKQLAHSIFNSLCDGGKIRYLSMKLPGIYGIGQSPNYNCVVSTFAQAIARGEDAPIKGTGNDKFNLLHVDELMYRTFQLIDQGIAGKYTCSGCNFINMMEEWTPNRLWFAMNYELDKYELLADIVEEFIQKEIDNA